MFIAVRTLKANDGEFHSVLDLRPLSMDYSIKTKSEMIALYNNSNQMITGLNYKVIDGNIVHRTSIGTGVTQISAAQAVKNISIPIYLNPRNIWTALSALVSNDSDCRVVIKGEPQEISMVRPGIANDSIIINDFSFTKGMEIHTVVSSKAVLEETMKDMGPDNDFALVRGQNIIFKLNNMQFIPEFSQQRVKLLVANLAPILSQLKLEYELTLDGFVSMYETVAAKPDVKGNETLVKFLKSNNANINNVISLVQHTDVFPDATKELYLKGIQEYVDYGNHSSLTYSMKDYFIYKYKVSEILLLQLALCNCG